MLHSFSPPPFASAEEERLHFLCPVQALKAYVDCSSQWCKSSQLFVCFEAGCRGFVSSKHRISHWMRDVISWLMRCGSFLHFWALELTLLGVLHLPRLFLVPLEYICVVAGWSSLHTFINFITWIWIRPLVPGFSPHELFALVLVKSGLVLKKMMKSSLGQIWQCLA